MGDSDPEWELSEEDLSDLEDEYSQEDLVSQGTSFT